MLYSREQILEAVRHRKLSVRAAVLMLRQLKYAHTVKQEYTV